MTDCARPLLIAFSCLQGAHSVGGTLPMADRTTSGAWSWKLHTISATSIIRSAVATDEPPNLYTTVICAATSRIGQQSDPRHWNGVWVSTARDHLQAALRRDATTLCSFAHGATASAATPLLGCSPSTPAYDSYLCIRSRRQGTHPVKLCARQLKGAVCYGSSSKTQQLAPHGLAA